MFVFLPPHHAFDRCRKGGFLLDGNRQEVHYDWPASGLIAPGGKYLQGVGDNLTNLTVEIHLINWSSIVLYCGFQSVRLKGRKPKAAIIPFHFFYFFQWCLQLICHGRQLSQDIKLSSWHFVYAVNQLCHLESAMAENSLRLVEGEHLKLWATCNISGSHWEPPAGSKTCR